MSVVLATTGRSLPAQRPMRTIHGFDETKICATGKIFRCKSLCEIIFRHSRHSLMSSGVHDLSGGLERRNTKAAARSPTTSSAVPPDFVIRRATTTDLLNLGLIRLPTQIIYKQHSRERDGPLLLARRKILSPLLFRTRTTTST